MTDGQGPASFFVPHDRGVSHVANGTFGFSLPRRSQTEQLHGLQRAVRPGATGHEHAAIM